MGDPQEQAIPNSSGLPTNHLLGLIAPPIAHIQKKWIDHALFLK